MEDKISEIFTKKFNQINKIFDTKKKYTIEFLDDNKLIFLNKNKKVLKAKYTFYGLHRNSQFIWATSMPLVKDSFKNKIKKMKEKKNIFYDDYINNQNELSYFFYTLLDNDTIMVNNKNLPWIGKLLMFLTDDIFITTPENKHSNLQFISLTEITEIFN